MNRFRFCFRVVCIAFALGGIALLGFVIYALARPEPPSVPATALSVIEPEQDLGILPIEQERLVKFRIVNNSSRQLGVLGTAVT